MEVLLLTTTDSVHWIDYIAAFGTVAASMTALAIAFWARSREDRQRPVLRLEYDDGKGDDLIVGFVAIDHEQHWLRMRVINEWGRRSADDVEVLVVRLVRKGSSDGRSINGYSLPWSNQSDAASGERTRITIPPGVARHFDLLSIVEPETPNGGGVWIRGTAPPGEVNAPAELAIRPTPLDGRHRLGAGTYTIILAVTARDTDAVYYAIDISFDGLWWSGDAIRTALDVKGPWVSAWSDHLAREGAMRFRRANMSRRARMHRRVLAKRRSARQRLRRRGRGTPPCSQTQYPDVRLARGDENRRRTPD
jgi:hypothetical protein